MSRPPTTRSAVRAIKSVRQHMQGSGGTPVKGTEYLMPAKRPCSTCACEWITLGGLCAQCVRNCRARDRSGTLDARVIILATNGGPRSRKNRERQQQQTDTTPYRMAAVEDINEE